MPPEPFSYAATRQSSNGIFTIKGVTFLSSGRRNEVALIAESFEVLEKLINGQRKVNKFKIFLPFSKFMKRPQNKFHAHTMSQPKVIRSKKSKFVVMSKFLAAEFFLFIDILFTVIHNRYSCAFAT